MERPSREPPAHPASRQLERLLACRPDLAVAPLAGCGRMLLSFERPRARGHAFTGATAASAPHPGAALSRRTLKTAQFCQQTGITACSA